MKRVYALIFAFLAVTLIAFYCRADLTAPQKPGLAVASAVFSTHPGMHPLPYIELDVKLKNPAACAGTITAMVGARSIEYLTRRGDGFHGSVAPRPDSDEILDENAPLRLACDGGALRDTGVVYRKAEIVFGGW